MVVLGVKLKVPTMERTAQAVRWLVSSTLLMLLVTAVTGGNMQDATKASLQWLPMAALWSWGWDPLRQGPSSWPLGVIVWVMSSIIVASVVHFLNT